MTTKTLLAALALLLAGCATDPTEPDHIRDNLTVVIEQPTDYGPMLCVYYTKGHRGGLSCTPLGWDPTQTNPR